MIGYLPNNQVNQMNEMIHLFRNNPLLYQEFNKMVTQNNENFKNNNLFNESYLRTLLKEKYLEMLSNNTKRTILLIILKHMINFLKKLMLNSNYRLVIESI